MEYDFSARSSHLKQSDIRAVTKRIEAIGGINLGQGLCPLPTDQRVREFASRAIQDGYNIYSPMQGLPEARKAISEKLKRDNGVEANPDSEVLITVGASGALACAMDVLLDPGDELILFEPFYGYHRNIALLRGISIQTVPTHAPSWEIDFDRLEQTITPKTRAILVCTPSNPSGKIYSRAELERIGEICKKHNLLAITDEVYEYIVFDDAQHISLASLPGMFERTISIGAATKTFYVTGWRIGWASGPADIIAKMANASDLNYICPPSPFQKAIADSFSLGELFFDNLKATFHHKRDALVAALRKAGIEPSVPDGAYYIMGDYSQHGWKTDEEARDALINGIGVGSVTGSSFYASDEPSGLLRFCFALEDEDLTEACNRLGQLSS